jgi:tRNA-specific 2-thiouridylase
MLGQRELARTLFPLGGLTKEEVRRLAAAMGLLVAAKPESQDLCFVADGDYRQELRRRIPAALEPGPVVDETGRRLGTHAGIGSVTVGQRTGLGIRPTGPDSRPLYVRSIDPATRAVVVGRREDLLVSRLELTEPSFVAGDAPLPMEHLEVRIRHGGELAGCRLEGGSVAVLDRPLAGVAPGQSAVLYRGPEVIGGGLIRRAA